LEFYIVSSLMQLPVWTLSRRRGLSRTIVIIDPLKKSFAMKCVLIKFAFLEHVGMKSLKTTNLGVAGW